MPLTDDVISTLSEERLIEHVIEECAELIHAASKTRRFGGGDNDPNKPGALPNIQVLGLELVQVGQFGRALLARYGVSYSEITIKNHELAVKQQERLKGLGYTIDARKVR